MDLTRQVLIIHLSDIHFGSNHQFNPPQTAGTDTANHNGYPSLVRKLTEDLAGMDPQCPVLICITGDFVETGSIGEFQEARKFIEDISAAPVYGKPRGKNSVFFVPGNHDVQFDGKDVEARWQQWTEFYNRLTGESVRSESPLDFVRLHDRIDDEGVLVLCLNSARFVEKGKPDQDRGQLGMDQLDRIEEALAAIDRNRLESSIRIALMHHHPILIPTLVERGRGYDAVVDSGPLLAILRRYGFHVVLHGHKHHPHTFTHDVDAAYQLEPERAIMIVAGGSAGSVGLPPPRAMNCYNRIGVKWHPNAKQSRIRIETRGLNKFTAGFAEQLPTKWRWETLKEHDQSFLWGESKPSPGELAKRPFGSLQDRSCNELREAEYRRTRGNLPVVEVMPSLMVGQAYEARFWIVRHRDVAAANRPVEVRWSAGPRFPVVTIKYSEDPLFCGQFDYWGPMLVQASMTFADGEEQQVYVYSRIPTDHSS